MARIVRREIRTRGFFGWVFLIIFLGFNALMALWLFSYWSLIGGGLSSGSEAGRAGAAIGATIATSMIFFLWAAGAVITGLLALLTRGQKSYIEETVAHRDGDSKPAIAAKELVPVGQVDAICPSCGVELRKKPSRKTKCPHCGEFIYARTRPSDRKKVLVTEKERLRK